jgi:hypothetical protein
MKRAGIPFVQVKPLGNAPRKPPNVAKAVGAMPKVPKRPASMKRSPKR